MECLQTVQDYPAGSVQDIHCLAVSRPTLVGCSWSHPDSLSEEYEAWVKDSELCTLEQLNTLRQPADQQFLGLTSDGVKVWGQLGTD